MSKPLELNPRMLSSLVCASALLSACGGGATPTDFASTLSAAPSTSATALEVTPGLPNAQAATAAQDLGPIAMAPPPASDDRPPEATAVEADQTLPTVTTEAITSSTLSVPLSLPPSTVETNSPATGLPPAPAPAPAPAPPAPAPAPGSYKILAGSGLAGVSSTNCAPKLANDFVDATFWHLRRLQPRDCDLVKINPPAFTWTLPRDRDAATPWKLVLRKAGGSTVATQTTDEPRLALTGGALAAGDYEWTVSYVTTGKVTQTSEVRRFTIAADAQPMALPTGDALAATVSRKPHPRVLPAGTSFAAIAGMASTGEYKPAYVNLIARANTSKTLALPSAPDQLSKVPGLGTLLGQAMDEQKNIESLGFAARFTGDKSYQSAGIARLLNLATWSPTGASSEASQDQINRAIYLALAQGLDLFGPDMTSAQRSAVAAPLKDRLGQAIVKFKDFDSYPYQSHLVSATNFVLEALLHVAGLAEFPESNQMLAKAWNTYVFEFNSWGYEDGGFGNGVAYSWFNLQQVPRTMAAIKIIGGVDLAKHPYMAHFGDSHIAMTAPMSKLISPFGDSTETITLFPAITRDEYRLYAALTRNPQHEWYWRSYAFNLTNPGYISPWHFMVLGASPAPVTAVAPAWDSWASPDAGLVAMHSKTSDPLRSSVFFRSSRFGSYNHSQADQNSFTLDSRGQNVLVNAGYYPYYNSPHHSMVGRATRYKNALTFDGGIGQAETMIDPTTQPTVPGKPFHSMDTRGQLINFNDNKTWATSTGDATLAYRAQDVRQRLTPLLSNAVRSVAYQRAEKVVVIYDYATSAKPRKWELNFHALNAFETVGRSLKAHNAGSSACIDVYGLPGTFALSDGFVIAPESPRANQFHGRYGASTASAQLASVTVIREDCRSVPVTVNVTGTVASVTINGAAPITFDQRTVKLPN